MQNRQEPTFGHRTPGRAPRRPDIEDQQEEISPARNLIHTIGKTVGFAFVAVLAVGLVNRNWNPITDEQVFSHPVEGTIAASVSHSVGKPSLRTTALAFAAQDCGLRDKDWTHNILNWLLYPDGDEDRGHIFSERERAEDIEEDRRMMEIRGSFNSREGCARLLSSGELDTLDRLETVHRPPAFGFLNDGIIDEGRNAIVDGVTNNALQCGLRSGVWAQAVQRRLRNLEQVPPHPAVTQKQVDFTAELKKPAKPGDIDRIYGSRENFCRVLKEKGVLEAYDRTLIHN